MPTIVNTFETGAANGSPVTAAGSGVGAAGTPADAVTVGAGNSMVYSTARPAHGTLSALIGIGQSSGQPAYWEWSTALLASSTSALLYARIGINFPAAISNGELAILRGLFGGNQRWRVALTAASRIAVYGASTLVATSSAVLSTDTHYRVEVGAAASATDANSSIEVRVYVGDSQTPLEVLGPFSTVAMGGPVDRIRFGVGASVGLSTAASLYVDDLGASTVGWLGPAVALPNVTHSWVGAVTHTSAVVSYGLGNVSNARLVVSTSPDLSNPVYSPAVAVDSDGFVKLTAAGLAADTDYHFGIEADGTLIAAGRGTFTTDPPPGAPASFSVAFGSCQQTNSNSETFQVIAEREGPYGRARRMLHEGDIHYRDFGAGTTKADIVGQWKSSLGPSRMRQLLRTIPTAYVWDNHDWGGANSDASTPAGPLLAQAYRQVVPHYPLPTSGSTGIWQSFVLGRVRFILLDTRSQRSPRTDPESPSKSMLGAEQKAWFYDQLSQPEPVKVIVCGIYWRHDSANGDRWGSYGTEFQEIRQWIQARPEVNAFVIFGDRHALAADDGSSAGCYLPQGGGAPFDQGSTQAFEDWSHGYYEGVAGTNLKAFGWLDITDAGSSITVAYSGITSLDGTTRVSMAVDFPAAAAVPARWGIHL